MWTFWVISIELWSQSFDIRLRKRISSQDPDSPKFDTNTTKMLYWDKVFLSVDVSSLLKFFDLLILKLLEKIVLKWQKQILKIQKLVGCSSFFCFESGLFDFRRILSAQIWVSTVVLSWSYLTKLTRNSAFSLEIWRIFLNLKNIKI